MINGRTVLVVVPARGGSKEIPLKNIYPLLGIPLVERVGHVIKQLPMVDRSVVSTDHVKIAKIARGAGIDAPFLRPSELSGDFVGDADVLNHALLETERLEKRHYDIIVLLQPTCPLRRPVHVARAIEKLVEENWDSLWTVSVTDSKFHPLKQLKIVEGRLEYYSEEGARIVARQQLDNTYHRNGAAYVITRNCLLTQKGLKGERAGALIIEDPLVSVDGWGDLKLAATLLDETEDEPRKVRV